MTARQDAIAEATACLAGRLLRLSHIVSILHIRHGGQVPFTDDTDFYLVPVANAFHKIAADPGLFAFWCSERAPNVSDAIVAAIRQP